MLPTRASEPYWRLSVTVLRVKTTTSADFWSESDLYLTLKIPSASSRTYRTEHVNHNNSPEWNQTFHFRLHSHIKNILEFQVYDRDPFTEDDLISTLLFDVNTLTVGKKETKVFKSNENELWVEFEMAESPDIAGQYRSNGVLMAPPLTALEVIVQESSASSVWHNFILKLRGAYKEDHVITCSEKMPLTYFINRDLETELTLMGEATLEEEKRDAVPIKPQADADEVKLSLPLYKDKVDLLLRTNNSPQEEFGVRLDFDIAAEEKTFLDKRTLMVAQALQKILDLKCPPEPEKVPLVAVVCSGGGTRAMTGTFGAMAALKNLGVLDAVSYISCLSGSTWAVSCLYEDSHWSRDGLEKEIERVKMETSKSYYSLFSISQLQRYNDELAQREKDGLLSSLIDMWGLVIEYLIRGEKQYGTLSDQRRAVINGQNPLPIYSAVNFKYGVDCSTADTEWCEFTPYEVGFPKYGAFVPAENCGSEFYLGHMVKKLPEARIPIYIGLWSSVFSLNLTQLWRVITGAPPSWVPWMGKDVDNIETDSKPSTLHTYVVQPVSCVIDVLTNFLTNHPVISQMYNFMRGFQFHWNYSANSGFTAWKDEHPDVFPNTLTPNDPILGLVDAGFACNSGFLPVLRSERQADVILSLNYSWDTDQFEVLKKTQVHCTDHKIPFPKTDFTKVASEPLKEVYVFGDEENPETPIIIHFPKVNVSFKDFKAPGVKRVGDEEKRKGQIDVSSTGSPYVTTELVYTPEVFQNFLDLASYNILNNKETIFKTLQKALQRGRVQQCE